MDAKTAAVPFYRRLGFMPLEVTEGLSEARPAPVAMFLSAREIGLTERTSTSRTKR